MAFEKLQQSQKRDVKVESGLSQRTETPAEAMGINNEPWSADEQKLLEQVRKELQCFFLIFGYCAVCSKLVLESIISKK